MSGTKQTVLSAFCNFVSGIVGVGSKEEMVRVDTLAVVAGMANMLPIIDGATEDFERNAMSALWFQINSNLSVAFVGAGCPIPATSLGINRDLGKQTIFKR